MKTRNFEFVRLWGLGLLYHNSKINVTYQKRVLHSSLVDIVHCKTKMILKSLVEMFYVQIKSDVFK